MEEVGAQLAHPFFIHQGLSGRLCEAPQMAKKRDLPWQNPNFQRQQYQQQQQRFQNPNNNWNPNAWDWDSVRFVAKPSEGVAVGPVVGRKEEVAATTTLKPSLMKKNVADEYCENLTLKLGGSLYEEPSLRPNKRVRSGSPGGVGGSYPMCQVDDCRGDLSSAKDYHRRHKVCESHSKAVKALVGKQMQRFCQQCSRFHPLSEFDEGKRSCRRRLAGHNRRRRKTQPEDVSSRLLTGNCEATGSGNADIVNLLTILARLQGQQGSNEDRTSIGAALPDRERLLQILSKINSLPATTNSSARLPVPSGLDLNLSHQVSSEQSNKRNGNTSTPSTSELLAIFSAALATSSPDALAALSQRIRQTGDNENNTNLNCIEQTAGFAIQNNKIHGFAPVAARSTTTFQSPLEASDRSNLPLQLFSSSPEDDSTPPKLSRKYFSSDSSNPMEERSPSASPPVERKLFPLQSASGITKHDSLSVSGEDNGTVEASTTHGGWSSPLELFRGPTRRFDNRIVQNVTSQAGYASSSGSDHSPSSSNSDAQDRTGRIIFKLFDKDPRNLPETLRAQIINWLAHSPSEMESYIRPGCVVLSIYLSMSSTAWEELQEDIFQRINSLVQDSDSEFWRSGRFLVHTDNNLASHKDGKIRLCKSWRTWSAPELLSVSPLAVVGGQETSLVLRGRNLTVPGTKYHCAYMGGYTSKVVLGSADAVYDDTSLESFSFPGGPPNVLSRCFIEIENGFKGNSFPVIIANALICKELRLLEAELDGPRVSNATLEDQVQDHGKPKSREDALHFLNELGWLFQRKNNSSRLDGHNFSHSRFKFLLTFSVERDWSFLAKTLLDLFLEINSDEGGLSTESIGTLLEIHLLNRAVKRKCRNMVNLLVQYSLNSSTDSSRKYLFFPNQAGPGGVTPLHLAACMNDSEHIVEALINDPQEIGLACWNTLEDANGQSPSAYATMRDNHSYNRLVARKITDRKNGHISIPIGGDASLDSWIIKEQGDGQSPQMLRGKKPCARCAVVMTKHFKRIPGRQGGLLHRPYVHSMLAIAAVCVCVCLFLRGSPDIGCVAPFQWENLGFGTI
ncbi:hypothetical protein GIB67_033763 [Kingdonia uniflora]|uniref:SBP-type domain-containing protein n=1 Tax=Kingdonia uniflora TaxID=39325 RepID=A0A7J7P456_9MAGN|nr:hypothetical protein GIB67_033763 [Kingdonia uniflora]